MPLRAKKLPEADIPAAGGVLVRLRKEKPPLVAVIHRPRHKDWSLPKGKLDPGETFKQAAKREVREETGMKVELGDELPPTVYELRSGKTKVVRYWLMVPSKPGKPKFIPNDEVDELRWLELEEAVELLDYAQDRDLVRKALKPRRLRALKGRVVE